MTHIEKKKYIECGVCGLICPEGIEIIGGKTAIKNKNANWLKDAAGSYPVQTINPNEKKI